MVHKKYRHVMSVMKLLFVVKKLIILGFKRLKGKEKKEKGISELLKPLFQSNTFC